MNLPVSIDYTKKAENAFCIQLASQDTRNEGVYSELLLCSPWSLDDHSPWPWAPSDGAGTSAAFERDSPTVPSASDFAASRTADAAMFLTLSAKPDGEA